jgi:pullulanase/glycogen debranching enzyme
MNLMSRVRQIVRNATAASMLPLLFLIAPPLFASTDSLDLLTSTKPLGATVVQGKTVFRLFAPNPSRVSLTTFPRLGDSVGTDHLMTRDADGVWEATLPGEHPGLYYGFRISAPGENPGARQPVCLDPYAKAVATFTSFMGPRRGIVVKDAPYDWQGDTWVRRDWRDLIIYEMHVRDLTAHPGSGSKHPGTYRGLVEPGGKGGIDYISALGVNTVELLPSQEFAAIEIPYRDSLDGRFNTWNPYGRNHWGYMTSSFFAPAAYYAEPWKEMRWNTWMGKDARAVTQFKDMVKAFHRRGIGVLMDVVYNHVSEFERANLKQIDPAYYFRLDGEGRFRSVSGCGNDLKTERPMVRRMIVESVLHWMKEYHVDGFRFDLAKMIDGETVDEIAREARKVNPDVVIIAEPWGGGYDPAGFSVHGWAAWNDQIRNGVKGQNPHDGLGWIFGAWQGNNNAARLKSYVNGTLARDPGGLFQEAGHAVNYLESHDDNTFGDFVRMGLRDVSADQKITDIDANAKLTPAQMQLSKLGALFLFTARGAAMIHEGQEYARSKVVANQPGAPDPRALTIDANSYNKDNATNYLNFAHARANRELVDYYRGLIALRKNFSAFRRAAYDQVTFLESGDTPFALGYGVTTDGKRFLVLMNADPQRPAGFAVPAGTWTILVNGQKAGTRPLGSTHTPLTVPPRTGFVLTGTGGD